MYHKRLIRLPEKLRALADKIRTTQPGGEERVRKNRQSFGRLTLIRKKSSFKDQAPASKLLWDLTYAHERIERRTAETAWLKAKKNPGAARVFMV